MRISDWSSDVCSSDLRLHLVEELRQLRRESRRTIHRDRLGAVRAAPAAYQTGEQKLAPQPGDRRRQVDVLVKARVRRLAEQQFFLVYIADRPQRGQQQRLAVACPEEGFPY